ncbi:MAG: hypothetical protein HYV45_02025 [Candidatus Moranbacteria bacterium]|nr:hypothetical protein [Candidatus Moranbacteria bacterium]
MELQMKARGQRNGRSVTVKDIPSGVKRIQTETLFGQTSKDTIPNGHIDVDFQDDKACLVPSFPLNINGNKVRGGELVVIRQRSGRFRVGIGNKVWVLSVS